MPTYDYECRKCGLRFEKFQNITARPLKTCPDCGGAARRLIGTGGAIIVKAARPAPCRLSRSGTRCGPDAPCRRLYGPGEPPPCER